MRRRIAGGADRGHGCCEAADRIGLMPGRRRDGRTLGRSVAGRRPLPREETLRTIGRRLSGIVLGTRSDRDRDPRPGDPGSARAGRAGRPGTGLPPVPGGSSGRRGRGRPDRFDPVLAGRSGIPRDGPVAGESRRNLAILSTHLRSRVGSNWGSTASIGRRWPTTWSSSGRPGRP